MRKLAATLISALLLGCHSEPSVVGWEIIIDPSIASFDVMAPAISPSAGGGSMVKGAGWGPWEGRRRQFSWVTETSAELWFPRPPAAELDLVMECRPFTYDGAPEQEMELVLNGEVVGREEMPCGWRKHRVRLPDSALEPALNLLELRFNYAISPAEVGVAGDPRYLAAAFRELSIVPRDLAHEPPAPALYDRRSGQLVVPAGAGVALLVPAAVRGTLELGGVECDRGDAELVVELSRSGGERKVLWRGDPTAATQAVIAFENGRDGPARLLLRHATAEPGEGELRIGFGTESLRMRRSARSRPEVHRPHVFIYVVDALRADALEVYGYERSSSPRLTQFSGEAVTYMRAVAPSTWTLPSVVSVLSGHYPLRHGVGFHRFRFEPEVTPSLARLLGAQGYDTLAVSHSRVVGAKLIADLGFDTVFYADSIEDLLPKTHLTRRFTTEWLLQRGERKAPVFGYVHTVVPHAPYTPGGEYRRFADASPSDLGEESFRPYSFQVEGHLANPQDLARLRALYDGEVAFADAQFGLFVDMLKYLGLYDQALIVFSSDHGEEFGEHQGFGHGRTLYSEQTGIPLLVKYPGGRGAGTQVMERVSTVDLACTIEEMIGADWAGLKLDGRSLIGLSERPLPDAAQGQRAIVSETRIGAYETLRAVHSRAVFIGRLKCVENLIRIDQFGNLVPRFLAFDLARDPDEGRPLPEDDPRLEKCRSSLALIAADAEQAHEGQPQAAEIDPHLKDALKALGYMD